MKMFYWLEVFEKLTFFVEMFKIRKNLENLKMRRGMRSCSTSYPSGNQVDGSPLVAIEQEVLPSKSNTGTRRSARA